MEVTTTLFDRALHLVMFVAGGAAVGLGSLAVIERIGESSRRSVRTSWVLIAISIFVVVFAIERSYHALS